MNQRLRLVHGGTAPSAPPRALREEAVRLEVEQLSVSYGERVAIRGVDLAVREHEILALIGPSGCGKTSLLTSLNRLTDLVPSCRVAGRILLDGTDVRAPRADPRWLRRRVGMIFQKPNPFPLSVRANIALALAEHVPSRAEREHRLESSLHAVGLWSELHDRLDQGALTLSGGQQQRLCIARALALEPEILLFDEPCSALDPIAAGVVEDLIVSLRDRLAVVVVTHNLRQARRIADRVAFFWREHDAGELVELGTRDEIFDHPRDQRTAAYVAGLRG